MVSKKRLNIYITMKTWQRLDNFISEKYGESKAISLIIEDAVREYLIKHRREVEYKH